MDEPVWEPDMSRKSKTNQEETPPEKDPMLVAVGMRISAARRKLGLSQIQLAEASGTQVSTVFSGENGAQNLSLKTLQKLADALKVDMRELLPGGPLSSSVTATMLTMIAESLSTTLKELGRGTLLLQQVHDLVEELNDPSKAQDRVDE
jgi:transcriptional regulator with XRE-family HTH domain